jgi:hypothetical protein
VDTYWADTTAVSPVQNPSAVIQRIEDIAVEASVAEYDLEGDRTRRLKRLLRHASTTSSRLYRVRIPSPFPSTTQANPSQLYCLERPVRRPFHPAPSRVLPMPHTPRPTAQRNADQRPRHHPRHKVSQHINQRRTRLFLHAPY